MREKILLELDSLLSTMGLALNGYAPKKKKEFLVGHRELSAESIYKEIISGGSLYKSAELLAGIGSGKIRGLLISLCEEKGLLPKEISKEAAGPLKDLILCKDIRFSTDSEAKYFLANSEGRVSELPAHHFISVMGIECPPLESMPVVPEYSPREARGIYEKENMSGELLKHINSYIPPRWETYPDQLPDKLPDLFSKLLNHIFPDPEAKEYFLHWTYRSIVSRADVYLILQGAGAIGKNRLKIHLRALHGHMNSADGKKNTLNGNFNGQLSDNTLLYFDEFKFNAEDENIMKEIPNGTLSIEKKFENTTKSSKIHCSMVIANNKEKDNYIAFDSRKFIPLQMTGKSLETSMTGEEISEMSSKVEFYDKPGYDIAYIAQIGRWILKHGESVKWPNCEYRGPKFWYLANTSMSLWQKTLLSFIFHPVKSTSWEALVTAREFKYSEVLLWQEKLKNKTGIRRDRSMAPDYTTAQVFLESYRDMDGTKIFSTKKVSRNLMGDFKVNILVSPNISNSEEGNGEDIL